MHCDLRQVRDVNSEHKHEHEHEHEHKHEHEHEHEPEHEDEHGSKNRLSGLDMVTLITLRGSLGIGACYDDSFGRSDHTYGRAV